MGKIYKIYKRNIYGVIGTLVFHILLVSAFLLAEIDRKGTPPEEELLIEFPDLVAETEPVEEEPDLQEREQLTSEASSATQETQNTRTNAASNRLARNDEFFDEEYQREVEEAKQMVANVGNQLSKETVNLDDIKMPVQSTEGMDPDSINNTVFSGESNIVYYLENRFHRQLPIPVYLSRSGGLVIVDIVVNRQGQVIQAEPRRNSAIRDEQIFLYAKAAASRTIFNADQNAPEPQRGSIHYTFVAQ